MSPGRVRGERAEARTRHLHAPPCQTVPACYSHLALVPSVHCLSGEDVALALFVGLFWALLGAAVPAALASQTRVVSTASQRLEIGSPLPAIAWEGLPGVDREYLGVEGPVSSTDDVAGEILVLEFLNTHCQSCMAQAPVMRELQILIDTDPELKGRARILAIAEGNTADETAAFRKRYRLPFPVVPDPGFRAFHAFGNPGGTPYTLLCVRRAGRWIVATEHLGAITTALLPYYDMKRYRGLDPSLFQGLAAERSAFRVLRRPPELRMPDAEIAERIRRAPRFQDQDVGVEPLELPGAGRAWRITGTGGSYFARLFSVAPVCDICHALHFVAVFDRFGEVAEFVPLRITKFGNQELSAEEVAFLRSRLLGFSGFRPRMFDPAADAVTGATMSSSLVFDALRNAGAFLQALIDEGLVVP